MQIKEGKQQLRGVHCRIYRWAAMLCMFVIFLFMTGANADSLNLPIDLTRIESEAFTNLDTDIVRFPDSLTFIADDAFTGASFIGIGSSKSYAEQWCQSHGFDFYSDQASNSVIFMALNAEGFAFSGKNGQESNPEDRMAHNIYSDPILSSTSGHYSAFSIDFLAEDTATATYWALCNWTMDTSTLGAQYKITDEGGAYSGLQITEDGPMAILSFWDIHYQKNGKDILLQAKRLYPSGDESYFGGEGEGTHYIGSYPWKKNHWYRMQVRCSDAENGNTLVEQWLQDLGTGTWTLMSRFDTGLKHSCLTGAMSQFMENYSGDYSNEFRSFRYRNIQVKEKGTQVWKPITQVKLSVDTWWDNKKGYYAFGSDNQSVWGITCGYGEDVVKTQINLIKEKAYSIPAGNSMTEP